MKNLRKYLIISLIGVSLNFMLFHDRRGYLSEENILGGYINNELSDNYPSKDSAMFQKAICDDANTKASWDNDKWGLLISNLNKKVKCNLYFYSGDTVFNFEYTGSEQTFTAPVSGTYKLETWGAQGGNSSKEENHGGYGGYSKGLIKLDAKSIVYIYTGGAGETMNKGVYTGGYNGGGGRLYADSQDSAGSGGGATHIATQSGLLTTLDKYRNTILIVSGGGGGGKKYTSSDIAYSGVGGAGGGYTGGKGIAFNDIVYGVGLGGSQTSGGSAEIIENGNGLTNGSFGQGAVVNYSYDNRYLVGAGGGGGFYGGGSIEHGPAGGGSGYIGNPLLTNKAMYCYNCEESNEENTKTISTTCNEETPTSNCAKKGNGYARITLVSIDE